MSPYNLGVHRSESFIKAISNMLAEWFIGEEK